MKKLTLILFLSACFLGVNAQNQNSSNSSRIIDEDFHIEENQTLYSIDTSVISVILENDLDKPEIESDNSRPVFPNDPLANNQWHLSCVNIFDAWNITKGSSSVKVAVLDNGFDWMHPDIGYGKDKYKNIDETLGWNFHLGNNNVITGFDHGIRVSGVIGTKTNNATGVAGISGGDGKSPGVTLIPINVSNGQNTVIDSLGKAIVYAVNMGAKVINMSFQLSFLSTAVDNEIAYAKQNNVVIVAAAGNIDGGYEPVAYPARHPDVIAVGALDQNLVGCERWGPELDISAPGRVIWTTTKNNDYVVFEKTSAATPIVSGIVALMFSINPNLTSQQVKDVIESTAKKVREDWHPYNIVPGRPNGTYHEFIGYGMVDAYADVRAARCPVNLPVFDEIITTNTTINTPFHVVENITIPGGVTLTLTSTLKCDDNVSIIINPGGKFIVNGGTITNACPDKLWRGITINGSLKYAGMVYVTNGGTIENARCAVTANAYCVVDAFEANFVNNTKAVFFKTGANGGSFKRTHFVLNNDYVGESGGGYYGDTRDFKSHILMQDCGGVSVEGCKFSSTVPDNHRVGNNGVEVHGSDLTVKEYCLVGCNINNQTNTCLEACMDKSEFTGFNNAILAANTGTIPNIIVRFADIKNNYVRGISLQCANYAKLIKNVFNITYPDAKGILVESSTGFKIEENIFIGKTLASGNTTYGSVIRNSGTPENEIYKNTYDNLVIAQQFLGINSSLNGRGNTLSISGLQTLCNIFDKTKSTDILLGPHLSYNTISIRENQGSMQSPAGNEFKGNPVYNIDNSYFQNPINYYYDKNKQYAYPNNVIGNVTRIPTTASNGCPSKAFGGGGGIPTKGSGEPDIEGALAQYDEWNAQYKYWLARAKEVCGDDVMMRGLDDEMMNEREKGERFLLLSEEKVADVGKPTDDGRGENDECATLWNLVSHYSALKDNYFNSIIVATFDDERINQDESVQSESSEFKKLEKLRFLFAYRGQYGDHLSIVETWLRENNFNLALATINEIREYFELSEYDVLELEGLQTYILWRQQLHEINRNIYELGNEEIEYLINYVKNSVGRGVVFANSILCVLYNICLEEVETPQYTQPLYQSDDEKQSPSYFEEVDGKAGQGNLFNDIKVIPNLTTGEFKVQSSRFKISSIEVYDIYGRSLLTLKSLMNQNTTVNISHLTSGIYFVKVTAEQGEVVKKVVKQ